MLTSFLYKGVVINNRDPEGRHRLQIFIPNLSTTLFKGWNDGDKDFKIEQGNLNSLDPEIVERLKKILPWAESSFPTFGNNGTTGYDTVRGQPTINGGGETIAPPSDPSNPVTNKNPEDADCEQYARDGETTGDFKFDANNPLHRFIMGVSQLESEYLDKEAKSDQTQTGKNSKGEQVYKPAIKNPENYDYGFGQFRLGDVRYLASFSPTNAQYLMYGTAKQQAIAFQDFLTKIPSNKIHVDNLQSGNYNALINPGGWTYHTTVYKTLDTMKTLVGTAAGSIEKQQKTLAANQRELLNYLNNTNGIATKKAEELNRKNPSSSVPEKWAKQYGDILQNNGQATGSTLTGSSLSGKSISPTYHITPHMPPPRPKDIREPDGINSVPAEGSFVWVTFYAGEVQRPVYMGGIAEPYSEARTQPVRPTATRSQTTKSSGGSSGTVAQNVSGNSYVDVEKAALDALLGLEGKFSDYINKNNVEKLEEDYLRYIKLFNNKDGYKASTDLYLIHNISDPTKPGGTYDVIVDKSGRDVFLEKLTGEAKEFYTEQLSSPMNVATYMHSFAGFDPDDLFTETNKKGAAQYLPKTINPNDPKYSFKNTEVYNKQIKEAKKNP